MFAHVLPPVHPPSPENLTTILAALNSPPSIVFLAIVTGLAVSFYAIKLFSARRFRAMRMSLTSGNGIEYGEIGPETDKTRFTRPTVRLPCNNPRYFEKYTTQNRNEMVNQNCEMVGSTYS